MVSSLLQDNYPGIVTEQCITADAAAVMSRSADDLGAE